MLPTIMSILGLSAAMAVGITFVHGVSKRLYDAYKSGLLFK